MRKVSLWMQMSLDGYTEGPNGEFDWPVVNEELHAYFVDELRAMGAFLYGRKVYEGMVAFWPTADMNPSSTPLQAEYARLWKPMAKIVFSKTLDDVEWNTTVVSENIADEVARMKQQPGKDLVLFGGADIASTFMRLGLIDEYRLVVHPVAQGGGTPLFPATDERVKLTLVEARTFDAAVVHLRYQKANETR
jgi:dihydrofolate reductase